MSTQPQTSSTRLDAVQWARAVAAISVAIGHSLHEMSKLPDVTAIALTLKSTIPFQIGVDIFFVISGFIMVYVTKGRLDTPGYAWVFLRARLLRIVPIYWLYTFGIASVAIVAPSVLDSAAFSVSKLLHSLFFFPGAGDTVIRPLLSLGWTLNYEMYFYLCFTVAILFAKRWTVVVLLIWFPVVSALWSQGIFSVAALRFWATPIVLEFLFGMIIGVMYHRGVRTGPGTATLLGVAAIGLLLLLLPNLSFATRFVVLGVPAALFVAALALLREGTTGRGLLSKAFVSIGDASYTLYLLHPFMITIVFLIWRKSGLDEQLSGWAYLGTTLAAILIGSLLAYRLIERPLTRTVQGMFLRQSASS